MKKLAGLVLAALGGREALREALLEALQEALEEEAPAKAPKAKAKAPKALEEEAPKAQAQAEPKAKARRKGPQADTGEVRRLVKALADLGAKVGEREHELLTRRAETLARKALPGKATQVLGGVLEYLQGLTLPEVSRAARLGYYDLAVAAGVGGLVEPPKGQ